jgi:hypothetical protein
MSLCFPSGQGARQEMAYGGDDSPLQDPNVHRAKLVGVTFVVRRLLPPQSKLGPDCGNGHR